MFNSRGLALAVLTKGGEGGGQGTSVRTSGNRPPTRYCDERPLETVADSLQDTASGLWDVDAVRAAGSDCHEVF